jgi:hypothetical protein
MPTVTSKAPKLIGALAMTMREADVLMWNLLSWHTGLPHARLYGFYGG